MALGKSGWGGDCFGDDFFPKAMVGESVLSLFEASASAVKFLQRIISTID